MTSLENVGGIGALEEAVNESSSLLNGELEQKPQPRQQNENSLYQYESISSKPRRTNNFIFKSVVYTMATALVIGTLCFAVVYTSNFPEDRPIEMIEAEGEEAPHAAKATVQAAEPMYNNNIFDPHEQGDDDYTSEYHPFYHQFVGKTLYMDGKYKKDHPRQGYNYHIEFFKDAGFTYWDTINYFPRINYWKIGDFAHLEKDTHEVTGNHHLANVINLVGGNKCDKPMNGNKTYTEGKVHLIWGEYTKLVNVEETAPCEFMLTVTSPDDQTFYPTSAPTSTPTSNPTMNIANLPVANRTRAEKFMKTHKKKSLRRAEYMALESIVGDSSSDEGETSSSGKLTKKSQMNLAGIQDGKDCVEGYFVGNEWHCKEKVSSNRNKESSHSQKKK